MAAFLTTGRVDPVPFGPFISFIRLSPLHSFLAPSQRSGRDILLEPTHELFILLDFRAQDRSKIPFNLSCRIYPGTRYWHKTRLPSRIRGKKMSQLTLEIPPCVVAA